MKILLVISYVMSALHEYTVCVDNSSLLEPLVGLQGVRGSYTDFRKDCYDNSYNKKNNKIKIGVYSSMSLLQEMKGTKKLINHINQLFTESNKIFINQFLI